MDYCIIFYEKSCNHCNKKYIGKMKRKFINEEYIHKELNKYKGSGKYWINHLKKYNCGHSTKILEYFFDEKLAFEVCRRSPRSTVGNPMREVIVVHVAGTE